MKEKQEHTNGGESGSGNSGALLFFLCGVTLLGTSALFVDESIRRGPSSTERADVYCTQVCGGEEWYDCGEAILVRANDNEEYGQEDLLLYDCNNYRSTGDGRFVPQIIYTAQELGLQP